MVWIISRNYNDVKMGNLMVLIANEIGDRVAAYIKTSFIFREDQADAMAKILAAKSALQSWYEQYHRIREKIFNSKSRDARWEFGKASLFDRTQYMAERCADLFDVGQIVSHFRNILGSKLKAVTGDAQGIDAVIARVDQLLTPIENIGFDVFDKRYQANWMAVMQKFHELVQEIDEDTRRFIDYSFDQLRSAENAFDLLQNFKDIQSRPSINEQMQQKFINVLHRYSAEVELTNAIFNANKRAPPCTKNQPHVAGAISWSRSLFRRIKKPILRFQKMEEMASETGRAVIARYIEVAKSMRDYEDTLFMEWKENVEAMTSEQLQAPLFQEVEEEDDEDVEPVQHLRARSPDTETMEDAPEPIPTEPRIDVNFNAGLLLTIRETKYLSQLDSRYKIPQKAQNVFLQNEKYLEYIADIKHMLGQYHAAIGALTEQEALLLQHHTQKLKHVLKPGFGPSSRHPAPWPHAARSLNAISLPRVTTISCGKST